MALGDRYGIGGLGAHSPSAGRVVLDQGRQQVLTPGFLTVSNPSCAYIIFRAVSSSSPCAGFGVWKLVKDSGQPSPAQKTDKLL